MRDAVVTRILHISNKGRCMNATPHPSHCPYGLTIQVETTAQGLFQAQASLKSGLKAAREALGTVRFAKLFVFDAEARGVRPLRL